ncbi:hypothetical protein A134_23130 [Vibrio crassostreae 9CS106]|uniref:Uncharacterized protein n=1 Tax=Vibrio crassostreae 9CS106 TaxID=1191300 RepID=A0A1B1C3C6_9VIBR|nr:hypothetical protein A134_23130 [Vibrio crassostreae 9CS106]
MANKSYLGKGTIYFEEIGGTGGLIPVGNCSQLDIAVNENKLEQKDYQEAGGALVNTVTNIDSVVASINSLTVNADTIGLALRGYVKDHKGGAVSDEEHEVKSVPSYIKLSHAPDKSATFKVVDKASPTTEFEEGTDFEIKSGGISIIADGAITDTMTLQVNFTSLTSRTVQPMTQAGLDYKVVFDGLNEAEGGKPVIIEFHKVKFNYTQALALISDDFGSLPMTFDILKDDTQTGFDTSKFMSIDIVE